MESEAIRNLAAVLIRKKQLFSKMKFQQKLHAVGLLILENDFLKKSGLVPLSERAKMVLTKIN
jgi:hypothetical protein